MNLRSDQIGHTRLDSSSNRKNDYASAQFPASLLYSHVGAASFRDVTTGTDDAGNYSLACTKTPACNAVKGYDLPTGVGTPNGISGF